MSKMDRREAIKKFGIGATVIGHEEKMDRRSLILGGVALITAPAIVRASSLMPVKVIKPTFITKEIATANTIFRNQTVGYRMIEDDKFEYINGNTVLGYDSNGVLRFWKCVMTGYDRVVRGDLVKHNG